MSINLRTVLYCAEFLFFLCRSPVFFAKLLYNERMKDITLEVLTSPGCVHCDNFLDFWSTAASEWPNVSMKEVSLLTEEGQAMVGEYQIFASPGIILEPVVNRVGAESGKHCAGNGANL